MDFNHMQRMYSNPSPSPNMQYGHQPLNHNNQSGNHMMSPIHHQQQTQQMNHHHHHQQQHHQTQQGMHLLPPPPPPPHYMSHHHVENVTPDYMSAPSPSPSPALSCSTPHMMVMPSPSPSPSASSCTSPSSMSSPSSDGPNSLRRLSQKIADGKYESTYSMNPPVAARRNERERNRVKLVNMGFCTLRNHVPNGAKNKKMSKVETLKSAVDYIRELQKLLMEAEAASPTAQGSGILATLAQSDLLSSTTTPSSSPTSTSSPTGPLSSPMMPHESEASSSSPLDSSSSLSFAPSSDEDLMSFKWFG